MTGPLTVCYLAGPPGAGKSTLMAALTAACTRQPFDRPFAHDLLTGPYGYTAVELGRRRERFPGTDTLSMAVQPQVLAWLDGAPAALILGEGDRLATLGFLTGAAQAGHRVHLFMLDAPGTLLDARCAQRGSTQSARWRAGRATKNARLAAHAEHHGLPVTLLDGRLTVPELATRMMTALPQLTYLGATP